MISSQQHSNTVLFYTIRRYIKMSNMQIFRSKIQSQDDARKPYLQALSQLAQASLKQMKALEGAPAWGDWSTSES